MIRIFDKVTGESVELDITLQFATVSIGRYMKELDRNREYNKKRYVSTGKPAGRPRKVVEPVPEPVVEPEPIPVRKCGRPRKYEFTVEYK
jgi:hypothetical protein